MNLTKLPAPALHGTFAKAYALLTQLSQVLGWDGLLRCRSEVFVMEDEYRKHKAHEEHRKSMQPKRSLEDAFLAKKLEETTLNDTVTKPKQAADENESEDKDNAEVTVTFGHKRLCERWLDNLFMVLYEDLRVYTYWRAEMKHYKVQKMAYKRTGTEWELLGDLSLRLWHEVTTKKKTKNKWLVWEL